MPVVCSSKLQCPYLGQLSTLTDRAVIEWHWPRVPGLTDFKGHMVHSAVWDHDYDYTGKTVAVIGNGSSALRQTADNLHPLSNVDQLQLCCATC